MTDKLARVRVDTSVPSATVGCSKSPDDALGTATPYLSQA
jgi:hypothetical protein